MGTALQLALVATAFEDAQRFVFSLAQLRVRLAWQMQAEPLAGQRLAILETGVADGPYRHASGAGNTPCRFLGVEVAFLDPEPEMFALPRERNIQHLIDLKIVGHSLEHGTAACSAMGARPEQLVFGHARTSSATACTAMPSSRPVKPSFSLVVALTLTWSKST